MIEKGKQVRIEFIGTLDNGSEFSNSYLVDEPFEFIVGSGEMLPAFERAVCQLEVGQETTIRIPADEAYGLYDESLIERVPVAMFPNALKLPIGEYIEIPMNDGEEMRVKVLKAEKGWLYFDHNHELAGQALNFRIKLVEVKD